ncbi:hypothetical protein Daus18300_011732 [Diaporthe australafricana]|uniref:LAGLIDADG endonuclease n=1 Tax=Diaporthe australafricana TaxID=127596 RepID=A0ABR3W5R9_9PEZI
MVTLMGWRGFVLAVMLFYLVMAASPTVSYWHAEYFGNESSLRGEYCKLLFISQSIRYKLQFSLRSSYKLVYFPDSICCLSKYKQYPHFDSDKYFLVDFGIEGILSQHVLDAFDFKVCYHKLGFLKPKFPQHQYYPGNFQRSQLRHVFISR